MAAMRWRFIWSMSNIYGMKPGEVFFAPPMSAGSSATPTSSTRRCCRAAPACSSRASRSGTPDAGVFWRVIAEHGVAVMFTAPTAFRAIKREDPDGTLIRKYDLRKFRALFLAGERADPPTVEWAERQLKVPVIDHWWQTETGWPITANCLGLEPMPVKHGSSTKPVPGCDLRVLDADGHELKRGEIGALCVKLPLPPGALPTLWNADERFVESYLREYPGYYHTADAGYVDEDGYVFVMTRTDDIINVAGHRLSTGAIEEVLAAHPDVAECAVIGVADALKGQVPLGFLVLKAGVDAPPGDRRRGGGARWCASASGRWRASRRRSWCSACRRRARARSCAARCAASPTARPIKMPATIDDPAVLAEITAALKAAGFGVRAARKRGDPLITVEIG